MAQESSSELDVFLVGGTVVGVGFILARVFENFSPDISRALGLGSSWGFASSSQQKKDEQNAIQTNSPKGNKCTGHCAAGCQNGQCLDSGCGILICCHTHHTHTHGHDTTSTSPSTPHTTFPNSGKCDPKAPCDSSGFCVDSISGQLIRCTPEKPKNKKCSGKCDKKTPCDSQNYCVDETCGRIIRCDGTTNRKPSIDIIDIPPGTYIPTQPTYIPGGDQTSTYPLPDNTDQTQVPPNNTHQTQVPDDSSSQEQPVQAQPELTPRPPPSVPGQTPRPVTPESISLKNILDQQRRSALDVLNI